MGFLTEESNLSPEATSPIKFPLADNKPNLVFLQYKFDPYVHISDSIFSPKSCLCNIDKAEITVLDSVSWLSTSANKGP